MMMTVFFLLSVRMFGGPGSLSLSGAHRGKGRIGVEGREEGEGRGGEGEEEEEAEEEGGDEVEEAGGEEREHCDITGITLLRWRTFRASSGTTTTSLSWFSSKRELSMSMTGHSRRWLFPSYSQPSAASI